MRTIRAGKVPKCRWHFFKKDTNINKLEQKNNVIGQNQAVNGTKYIWLAKTGVSAIHIFYLLKKGIRVPAASGVDDFLGMMPLRDTADMRPVRTATAYATAYYGSNFSDYATTMMIGKKEYRVIEEDSETGDGGICMHVPRAALKNNRILVADIPPNGNGAWDFTQIGSNRYALVFLDERLPHFLKNKGDGYLMAGSSIAMDQESGWVGKISGVLSAKSCGTAIRGRFGFAMGFGHGSGHSFDEPLGAIICRPPSSELSALVRKVEHDIRIAEKNFGIGAALQLEKLVVIIQKFGRSMKERRGAHRLVCRLMCNPFKHLSK